VYNLISQVHIQLLTWTSLRQYKKMLEWREAYQVDTMLERPYPNHDVLKQVGRGAVLIFMHSGPGRQIVWECVRDDVLPHTGNLPLQPRSGEEWRLGESWDEV
jgi:hypothetical protein